MTPLRTGIALAATVGLFYALCTLIWLLAPGPFLAFMNSLFPGMDFSAMVQPGSFSVARFVAALVVLSGWAFGAGLFFGWLGARLARDAGTVARSTP